MTHVIDATLREGMQTAAGTFDVAQSVEVARLLSDAGVDTIECGHPGRGEEESARVAAVAKAVPHLPVLAHARATREDIEAAASCGAGWVGVFLGVDARSRRCRVSEPLDELLDRIRTAVIDAHRCGLSVRMTVEDAGRAGYAELEAAFRAAADAGAERLCFSDTVGALEPPEVAERVREVRGWCPGVDVEVHLHDDRGLALAGALAAVDAGATWVSASVNSLGERAGIPDLGALLANLHLRGDRTLPRPGVLDDLSRRVGAFSRSHPDERRPMSGRNVFHHQAKLHVRAVDQDPASYEVLDPALLGRTRSLADPDRNSTTAAGRAPDDLVVVPPVIDATELRYHRSGPGERFVLVDDRFVEDAKQYCIARRIPPSTDHGPGHIDPHVHSCDSLFGFLGDGAGYTGLTVEVRLGETLRTLTSPASVFIPAGLLHSYRAVEGSGTYLNHVLSGSYEKSLLDPLPDAVGAPEETVPANDDVNAKSGAWDHVGDLFWTVGRVSARPSRRELDAYLDGVRSGQRVAVVGASTKELVEAARDLGAEVTVLDFSRHMCDSLAAAVDGVTVRQVDITRPLPADLAGTQDWAFSDRLLNRFAPEEAQAGARGLVDLLAGGGTARTAVKLGRYPMDDRMIETGTAAGTVDRFWDETTSTMDFAAAGEVLEQALVPHGEIDREVLLNWYRGRGREKRFSDDEVRALLAGVAPGAVAETSPMPDAPGTSMYLVRVPPAAG